MPGQVNTKSPLPLNKQEFMSFELPFLLGPGGMTSRVSRPCSRGHFWVVSRDCRQQRVPLWGCSLPGKVLGQGSPVPAFPKKLVSQNQLLLRPEVQHVACPGLRAEQGALLSPAFLWH